MQADKLRDLRELLAKATPGPWEAVNDVQHHRAVIRSGLTPVAEMWMVGQPEAERQATAALIAAMHEALPELLAIAEAAEGLRARLAKADCVIERIADMYDDERAQFQQKQDAYDMADAARTYLHDRDAALSTVAPVREGTE